MPRNAAPEAPEEPPLSRRLAPAHPPSSLEKAITILTSLSAAREPMSLAELSRTTRLPKTTVYRLLGVLCRRGLAQRIGVDYAVGGQLATLAGPGSRMVPGARRLVLPHLIRLYELTRQTVNLAVPRGLEVSYVERVYGHSRVSSPSDEVDRAPLHCTATGKVLLAFGNELNAALREHAFSEHGALRRMTRRTLVGWAALDRELCAVRRQGVAYSREEFAEGVVCAAAPVFGPDGRISMAVGVACPSPTAPSAEIADMVKRTAHAISASLLRSLSGAAVRPQPDGFPASFL
ncbi:IclR family transcriptional regulator [Planotetraspora sp. A-T 1434]|uniref:IclR family transcriptional regulator n=1 Tax=Planotetraspora sp. A-T 1434 TaxID=2979219 RepID=UPI0021C1596E|nr:IclR family transcriptional regulator [Planotetraspora sp. A-T 1434]MCT9933637.1 IclR family transcriptional regulator [Planotetraspora sp. A-T 1434]